MACQENEVNTNMLNKSPLAWHDGIWQGEAEVWLHSYLTLALEGGKWSASKPSDFTAGKDIRYPLNGSLGGTPF